MKTLRTQIQIQGTPEQVWNVLTDFDRYTDWNPFICRAVGLAEPGSDLIIQCQGLGWQPTTLHCEIVDFVPQQSMSWKWKIGANWMCWGSQQFTIKPLGPETVLFEQRSMMDGPLLPLLARRLCDSCPNGIRAMDHALKARVESAAHNHSFLVNWKVSAG